MSDATPTPDTAADLRTPDEWSRIKQITVHGPDGWRRDGKPWSEPISEAEFMSRASVSSCEMSLGSSHPWADKIKGAVLGGLSATPTPDTQNAAVNNIITESLRAFRKSQPHRRHPCEVTSDRLGDHLSQYGGRLTGGECDAISHVRHILEILADVGDQHE